MRNEGLINRYRERLTVSENTPVISLGEGSTPLIRARRLERELNSPVEIHLKYDGMNPTGSFKDRGMTMAVSKAVEKGAEAVICASTGNTSASAAAYAARAGIKCFVIVPEGNIALGKLAQALICGAKVIAVSGNFDRALEIVREIVDEKPVVLVNSINPYRIEGQKTGAFEVCDALGEPPAYHLIPVGNAGNITAYWKGYTEYKESGKSKFLPKMLGFQAEGSAPIVAGCPVKDPETVATAIRIGNPASWKEAVSAAEDSNGLIAAVSDEEILSAYSMLAGLEGVFVEPASAASVAGLIKLIKTGYFKKRGEKAVCVLTGHGLKDPDRAISSVGKPKCVAPEKSAVLKEMSP